MNDLVGIARRINDRQKLIEELSTKTIGLAGQTMAEVLLQGKELLEVKAGMKHGQWLPWLSENCKRISARTANDYMRLAENPQHAAELLAAGSIREALCLLRNGDGSVTKPPKQWPGYLEATQRLSKLVDYVERNPCDAWPSEGLQGFREKLEPLAKLIWPDKFT